MIERHVSVIEYIPGLTNIFTGVSIHEEQLSNAQDTEIEGFLPMSLPVSSVKSAPDRVISPSNSSPPLSTTCATSCLPGSAQLVSSHCSLTHLPQEKPAFIIAGDRATNRDLNGSSR
jgi:hypothetical protein